MSKQGFVLRGVGLAACFVVGGAVAVHAGESAPRPRTIAEDFTGVANYQCRAGADGGGTLVEHSRTAAVEGAGDVTYQRFASEATHRWRDAAGNLLAGQAVRTRNDREGNPREIVFDVTRGVVSTASPAPTPTVIAPAMADTVRIRMRITEGRETLAGPCEPLTSAQLSQRGTTIVRTMPFEGEFHFIAE